MANGIKIKFCLGQQTAIQFSHQDCFIFKIRPGQKLTKRTYDTAPSSGKHVSVFLRMRWSNS